MHHDQPELPSYGREGSSFPPGENRIGGTLTHGGRFVQYNLLGNLFDLTPKYQPPIQTISRGAYGIVCSAWNAETKEVVAVKKISNAFDNVIIAKRTLREITILSHMRHENILEFKEVIPPPQKDNFKDVYIVTELMDTDLRHVLKKCEDLTEEHYQFFVYQLLRGLKYIHSANVLHRDLKPSNLLINEDCGLKIADFGLSRIFSETDLMTEYVVTRWYRPPELLLNAKNYTPAIDMWSVGCILTELYNHEPLFPGNNYVDQFHSIVKLMGSPSGSDLGYLRSKNARKYLEQLPKYPKQPLALKFPHLPALVVDLAERMLTYDPTKRITAEEALEHPYLAPFHDPMDETLCPTPFVMDFEEQSLSEEDIRELIYEEAMKGNTLTNTV